MLMPRGLEKFEERRFVVIVSGLTLSISFWCQPATDTATTRGFAAMRLQRLQQNNYHQNPLCSHRQTFAALLQPLQSPADTIRIHIATDAPATMP